MRDPVSFQKNGIQEIFRLEPPFMCAARRALEDLQFRNIQVKINDRLVFVLGSANRDPSIFPDPNKLDLYRPNASKQLTF
jgi:cytochrome P450